MMDGGPVGTQKMRVFFGRGFYTTTTPAVKRRQAMHNFGLCKPATAFSPLHQKNCRQFKHLRSAARAFPVPSPPQLC